MQRNQSTGSNADNSAKQFAEELNVYLANRFGYKDGCVALGTKVSAFSAAVEVYLRVPPLSLQTEWPVDTLVLAKVAFSERRAGHGASLLQLLVKLSSKYGYNSIGVEETHKGVDIQNFVRKYCFKALDNDRNWIMSVKELGERLQQV